MSTPTLSRLTMETMANYRAAATQVVAASSAGSRRLVRAADGTLHRQVVERAAKVAPQAGERIDAVRANVRRLVLQGIDQFEQVADTTIERSSEFAVAQVSRLADLAADVKAPVVAGSLQNAARLSVPAAQLALLVSSKLAEGAASLAGVAGARPVRRTVRQAAKGARRAATKVTRAAAKTANKGGTPGARTRRAA
ncbi:MAG: hypothetical protein KIT17_24500 [Rubrivivax sp.]|nr:hypothetical protein [Rubrivivax sp.]